MIVYGYHGTSESAADEILRVGFQPSRNAYDWLGDGVYFFQDSPERAWIWADRVFPDEPAVLGAEIELVDCLDLLQQSWSKLLNAEYNEFLKLRRRLGQVPPQQSPLSGARRLDREVINHTVGRLQEEGFPVRTVRGVFAEGAPAFPESGIADLSHVQIAVRDTSLIVRMWREDRPPPLAIGGAG